MAGRLFARWAIRGASAQVPTVIASYYSRCWDTVLNENWHVPSGNVLGSRRRQTNEENLICEITSASTEFHGKMKLVKGKGVGGVVRRLQTKTSLRRAVQQKGRETNIWGTSVPSTEAGTAWCVWGREESSCGCNTVRRGSGVGKPGQEIAWGRSAATSTGRPVGRSLDFILSITEGRWELWVGD